MNEQAGHSEPNIHTMATNSEVLYSPCCDICKEDDLHLEAEGYCTTCSDFLCGECFKGHKRSRACRNHVLQDKAHMPRQKSAPVPSPKYHKSSRSARGKAVCTEMCTQHPDQLVEYYCWGDKTMGCTVCMQHKNCEGVDHIPDIAEKFLTGDEYQQFIESLENLKSRSQNLMQNTTDNELKADNWFDAAASRLQELRQKMKGAFDRCEETLKATANTIKTSDKTKIKTIAAKGNAIFDEAVIISDYLQSLQNKNRPVQMFTQMKKLEDRVKTLHRLLTEAETDNSVTVYNIEPGSKMQQILYDPDSIGTLVVQASDRPSVPQTSAPAAAHVLPEMRTSSYTSASVARSLTGEPSTQQSVRDIKVRTESDKEWGCCFITGSVLLPGNKLVVSDSGNSKVKLVSLEKSKVTSELNLSAEPWDVTDIKGDQVAVTFPDDKKILFVEVTEELREDREMTVNGKCTAIVNSAGKMVVAFSDPMKIEIMDLNGIVERKIEQSGMFKWPSHMVLGPAHDTIYVSDSSGNCVKMITFDGVAQIVYRDSKLTSPSGMTVDQQGRVLVCAKDSGNIHQLSSDLSKGKLLIERGLNFPQSLTYCNSTGMLFVGMFSNTVKLFKLT